MAAAKKYHQLLNQIEEILKENGLPPPAVEEEEDYEKSVTQSLQNLSKELKKYRMLFEHAADPVFVHDYAGNYT
jgi:SOS-response transcriptional repressor LexA